MKWPSRRRNRPNAEHEPADQQQSDDSISVDEIPNIAVSAVVALISERIEDPDNERISGNIELDDFFRIKGLSDFLLNGAPIMPSFDAIEEANKSLIPLTGLPADHRFVGFSFIFDRGRLSIEFTRSSDQTDV